MADRQCKRMRGGRQANQAMEREEEPSAAGNGAGRADRQHKESMRRGRQAKEAMDREDEPSATLWKFSGRM